jgi:serine phosphatase RsbU (regulator of sigma subunit)
VLFAASQTGGVGMAFEAAVFALSYVLSIALLGTARRQSARAAALTHERRAAQSLHDELVPRTIAPAGGWRFEVAHLPFEDVGGDFFDALAADDGLGLFFGDVSGKGMRAAMLLSALKLLVRGARASSSGGVLAELNHYLAPLGRDGTFCTAWHGRFGSDGRVRFAIAGHEPPLHLRADGSVAELPVGGVPLGVSEGETFPEFELALAPGEALAIYSDGLSDLFAAGIAPRELFAPGGALAERLRTLPRRDDVLIVIATREAT